MSVSVEQLRAARRQMESFRPCCTRCGYSITTVVWIDRQPYHEYCARAELEREGRGK